MRAIYAIARDRGYDEQDLKEMLARSYGTGHPAGLSLSDASSVIDSLKNGEE